MKMVLPGVVQVGGDDLLLAGRPWTVRGRQGGRTSLWVPVEIERYTKVKIFL
jgi:hypothetical protein